MVPTSLIPGKKLLIEITQQCFTSPWENCIEKLTEEGGTLSPGKGIQRAGVGQNPWGHESLLCSCKPIPLPAQLFCTLTWAMTAHCTSSLWHLIAFCTHVFPWLCDVCLSPYQRLYSSLRIGTVGCAHTASQCPAQACSIVGAECVCLPCCIAMGTFYPLFTLIFLFVCFRGSSCFNIKIYSQSD